MINGKHPLTGALIQAMPSTSAVCPGCGGELVPKCGEINVWHWAHIAGECDPWSEPESQWHLAWKSLAAKTEVVMGPHRADIVGPRGVVELQHSSLNPATVREREDFYGRMIWVIDVEAVEENFHFRTWQHGRRALGSHQFQGVYCHPSHCEANPRRASSKTRCGMCSPSSVHDDGFVWPSLFEWTFAWLHKRKWIGHCKRPVFLDFGRDDWIFHLTWMPVEGRGGKGEWMLRDQFVDDYIGLKARRNKGALA